jgi:hypothetical protein
MTYQSFAASSPSAPLVSPWLALSQAASSFFLSLLLFRHYVANFLCDCGQRFNKSLKAIFLDNPFLFTLLIFPAFYILATTIRSWILITGVILSAGLILYAANSNHSNYSSASSRRNQRRVKDSSKFHWKYSDNHGTMQRFNPSAEAAVEEAYIGCGGQGIIQLSLSHGNYELNFTEGMQRNLTTNAMRRIERVADRKGSISTCSKNRSDNATFTRRSTRSNCAA